MSTAQQLHRLFMSFSCSHSRAWSSSMTLVTSLTARRISRSASSWNAKLASRAISRTSVPRLIVFEAPSKPTEHRTRRSTRSPHSISDYYSFHRHVPVRPPSQARLTVSASTSPFHHPPLNSVPPHPAKSHSRTFDSPSKPREYYARPQPKRDLPELTLRLPHIIILAGLGLSAWGAFILYATNMERASSSVVRQLCHNLKTMTTVREVLGDDVKAEGKWWLNGVPWIDGAINLLQGNVDVSFRVRGSKGAGTLYFTSVRGEKGQPFTILRSKIICDDGVVLKLAVS